MFSDVFKYMFFNVHKEGLPFIGFLSALCFLAYFISGTIFNLSVILTLCCALFFRDPQRFTIGDPGIVVSPADGIITKIEIVDTPADLGAELKQMRRISIFLSVFDVHVNRIPVSGLVQNMHYHEGKFINANLDKASNENERQIILIQDDQGYEFGVVQIAGLIARRIVCDLKVSQNVRAGERFGIIRFGSRVDLYLPLEFELYILEGQRMIGGETIITKVPQNKVLDRLLKAPV